MNMKSPDPKAVAGNVYKVLLENERVRVFDVHFKPGAKAVMHWHPDHVGYVINGGKLKLKMGDGSTSELELPTGEAVFLESQSHEAVNVGNGDVHAIVVELLK
jgi:quercetin dioxygenase-like cupin family protein